MKDLKPGDPAAARGCVWAVILGIPLYAVIIIVLVLIIKALTGW